MRCALLTKLCSGGAVIAVTTCLLSAASGYTKPPRPSLVKAAALVAFRVQRVNGPVAEENIPEFDTRLG
jgi:hypothetical protein